ncbi:MAG: hypothetical protein GTO14_08155, partial [Anaerolineales bacterium]|nr:hypothetical protein [Anaerolineales bacterium]
MVSIVFVALAVYSVVDNKLAIFVGISTFLLGFWILWYVINRYSKLENTLTVALVLCLSLGLTIRAEYPSPGLQTFGDETIEQAVVFMMDTLEPESRVLASEPGYVLAARMNFVMFSPEMRDFDSSDDFYQWLVDNDIKAIRSTSWLAKWEPQIWALIEDQIGEG